jgi:hypothetical protein
MDLQQQTFYIPWRIISVVSALKMKKFCCQHFLPLYNNKSGQRVIEIPGSIITRARSI